MLKRILAVLMILAIALGFAACGSGSGKASTPAETAAPAEEAASAAKPAAEPIHLSLGHTNNTEHHYHVLSEEFKRIVEEQTNGAIIIDIFPAEQLGSGVEMLEAVKNGTQDIVIDPDAYLASYDPVFNVSPRTQSAGLSARGRWPPAA